MKCELTHRLLFLLDLAAGFSSFFNGSCAVKHLKIICHKIYKPKMESELGLYSSFILMSTLNIMFFLPLPSPLLALSEVLLGTEWSWLAGEGLESTLIDSCENRMRKSEMCLKDSEGINWHFCTYRLRSLQKQLPPFHNFFMSERKLTKYLEMERARCLLNHII